MPQHQGTVPIEGCIPQFDLFCVSHPQIEVFNQHVPPIIQKLKG